MSTQQEVLDVVGEKWSVTYDLDGKQMMGLCNHSNALRDLISKIRASGGKNLHIRDQTIFFVDDKESE